MCLTRLFKKYFHTLHGFFSGQMVEQMCLTEVSNAYVQYSYFYVSYVSDKWQTQLSQYFMNLKLTAH